MRRAILLAVVLALVAGTAGADFIRYHPPQLVATSSGAFTLSGPLLLPDGSAAAPSLSFANDPDTGIYRTGPNQFALVSGGSVRGWLTGSGIMATTLTLDAVSQDVILVRDAANTLALRNGGTAGVPVPQTFNVYNFCDGAACATGYERAVLSWVSNVFTIYNAAAGTGAATRSTRIASGGSGGSIFFRTASTTTDAWGIDAGANKAFYPITTDTTDIGGPTYQVGILNLSRLIQGSKSKSLTDAAAAVAYATIAVPTNGQIAGELIWTATSSAAAVRFVANGSIRFWGVDEGGTPVCGINAIGTPGEGHSSGANTLVCTWSNVVATTNCAISVTCTNDTAGVDPITVYGRFNMPTTATITFN